MRPPNKLTRNLTSFTNHRWLVIVVVVTFFIVPQRRTLANLFASNVYSFIISFKIFSTSLLLLYCILFIYTFFVAAY